MAGSIKFDGPRQVNTVTSSINNVDGVFLDSGCNINFPAMSSSTPSRYGSEYWIDG